MQGLDLVISISEGRSFFQLLSLRLSDTSAINRETSKILLFYSLHFCYAELVCLLVIPETRKVAPAIWHQKIKSRIISQYDLHGTSNIPGNLHESTRRGKGARDVACGLIVLGWPGAQKWIQFGRNKRHWDGLRVHGRRCAEIASDIERPCGILVSASTNEGVHDESTNGTYLAESGP